MKEKSKEFISIKELKDKKYHVTTMYVNRQLHEDTINSLVNALDGAGFHQPILLSSAMNFIQSGLPFSWKGKPVNSLDDLDQEGRELAENDKLLVTYDGHHRQKAIEEYCRQNRKQRRLLGDKVIYLIRWDLVGPDLLNSWNDVNNVKSPASGKDNLQQVIQRYYGTPWIEFDRGLLNLLNAGFSEQVALHLVSYGKWGYRNKSYLDSKNLSRILVSGKSQKPIESLTASGFTKSMVLISLLESKLSRNIKIRQYIQENKYSFLTKLLKLEEGGNFYNGIDGTRATCVTPISDWEELLDFVNLMLTEGNLEYYFEIQSREESEYTTATFRRGAFLVELVNKYHALKRTKEDFRKSVSYSEDLLNTKQSEIKAFYQDLSKQLDSGEISKKIYNNRIYNRFKRGDNLVLNRLQHQYYLFTQGQ